MTIDEAKQLIVDHGLRPLEQRGFYSHFLRAIDDTRTYWSATVDRSQEVAGSIVARWSGTFVTANVGMIWSS